MAGQAAAVGDGRDPHRPRPVDVPAAARPAAARDQAVARHIEQVLQSHSPAARGLFQPALLRGNRQSCADQRQGRDDGLAALRGDRHRQHHDGVLRRVDVHLRRRPDAHRDRDFAPQRRRRAAVRARARRQHPPADAGPRQADGHRDERPADDGDAQGDRLRTGVLCALVRVLRQGREHRPAPAGDRPGPDGRAGVRADALHRKRARARWPEGHERRNDGGDAGRVSDPALELRAAADDVRAVRRRAAGTPGRHEPARRRDAVSRRSAVPSRPARASSSRASRSSSPGTSSCATSPSATARSKSRSSKTSI